MGLARGMRVLVLFLIFLIFNHIKSAKSVAAVNDIRKLNVSIIYEPSTGLYENSAMQANYACSSLCPRYVIRPTSEEDVAVAVKFAHLNSIPITVRGGGHGYTCQQVKSGGILLDMRSMQGLKMHMGDHPNVEVDSGLTWEDVIPVLRRFNLTTVHGQCTSVGVAGFMLHGEKLFSAQCNHCSHIATKLIIGGVHFGGLSELFGFASDNILALRMIIANGSTVNISPSSCTIDKSVMLSKDCKDLWFALRGAGSSFGVVTSLTIRLFSMPQLRSALSLLSIDISDPILAAKFLMQYMSRVPSAVSLTFFGLDQFFKAYFFVIKFARHKFSAIANDPSKLFGRGSKEKLYIHFIVEASWEVASGEAMQDWNGDMDSVFHDLKLLHQLRGCGDGNNECFRDHPAVVRSWYFTDGTWSVPSYDLVWGAGHAYAGATVTVGAAHEEAVLVATLSQFRSHLSSSSRSCSDCVVVMHRVGEGIRHHRRLDMDVPLTDASSGDDDSVATIPPLEHDPGTDRRSDCVHGLDASQSRSAINPFYAHATLWVEVDCGHFHRSRSSWPQCSRWVDDMQAQLDGASASTVKPTSSGSEDITEGRAHYPNVPNLSTDEWQSQYYGLSNYERLQRIKATWDPHDQFSHAQSVKLREESKINQKEQQLISDDPERLKHSASIEEGSPTTGEARGDNSDEQIKNACVNMYDRKAGRWMRRAFKVVACVTAVGAAVGGARAMLPRPILNPNKAIF